jgi:hypothetical protein
VTNLIRASLATLTVVTLASTLLAQTADTQLPAGPTNARAVYSDGRVTLTWNPAPDATGYRVMRRPTRQAFTILTTVSSSTVSFTDSVTLDQAYQYEYAIAVETSRGVSPSILFGPIDFGPPALERPTHASATYKDARVTLVWDPVSHADSYRILRRTNQEPFSPLATVSGSTRQYIDVVAPGPDEQVEYGIMATGMSGHSPLVTFALAGYGAVAVATNLRAIAETEEVILRWDAEKSPEGFIIYRSHDNGAMLKIAELSGAAREYTDRTVRLQQHPKYQLVGTTLNGPSLPLPFPEPRRSDGSK